MARRHGKHAALQPQRGVFAFGAAWARAAGMSFADGSSVIFYFTIRLPAGYHRLHGFGDFPLARTITIVAAVPMVLSVNPSVKANTAKELVDEIKKNPGKYSYGSAGKGSALHMAVELLKYQEHLDVVHASYRGASQAIQSVMSGDLQFITDAVSTSAPMIKAGRLKALAVTTGTRSSVLPNVPTMKEAGFPNYETSIWNMVMVPRGTPAPVIEKLSVALQQAVKDPEVRERMEKIGVEPVVDSSPDNAARFVQAETRRWAEVIKAGNIQAD
ncbi:Bug family tripartite tricarboxylate transporter substrate binding protein [Cupriavidus basilensis]|uniref:Bug family tripartite tricarboxylate transporter substrate binding protein n=1 Tax=Cupriavidus basilensis TaxID=68895 RepID=UPI0039F71BED